MSSLNSYNQNGQNLEVILCRCRLCTRKLLWPGIQHKQQMFLFVWGNVQFLQGHRKLLSIQHDLGFCWYSGKCSCFKAIFFLDSSLCDIWVNLTNQRTDLSPMSRIPASCDHTSACWNFEVSSHLLILLKLNVLFSNCFWTSQFQALMFEITRTNLHTKLHFF